MQKGFTPLFILVGVLIIAVIAGGAFYLGQQTPKPQSQNSVVTSQTSQSQNNIPVKDNTVSFTKVKNTIYLRYRDKIYDDSDQFLMEPINLPNENILQWVGLIDAPEDVREWDELFSFKVMPNYNDFLFVMRWTKERSVDRVEQEFRVFYYDASKSKLSNPLNFKLSSGGSDYNVPKIDQISADGKYVSFDMYGCWNCGGHKSETLLLNLETNMTKRIGKVLLFRWKDNGKYEYKDYIVKECSEPTPGECSEDAENLPTKTGQF